MLFFALASLIFFIDRCYSQEYTIIIGSERYPCTREFTFQGGSSFASMEGGLKVTIIKRNNSGYLKLSSHDFIMGSVYVFLTNGRTITCTERNIYRVNEKNIRLYDLTQRDIRELMDHRIDFIRYTARVFHGLESYTAKNQKESSDTDKKQESYYDTASAIRQLFGR